MAVKPTLKHELGFFEVTLSGVGSILGAGIYVLVGKAAGLAGNAVWLSFLFAAMAAGLTGIAYMELSSMLPKAGAEYEYVKRAFGEDVAFIVGWLVIIGLVIAVSAVALGFAGYFSALSNAPTVPAAILLIMIFAFVLFIGIKQSAHIIILMTLIEIIGLLVIIYIGLPYIGSVNYFETPTIPGIFEASALIFFAYLGFEDIVKLSQETKEPEKTIPKALIMSIIGTLILYILVALSAVSVVNWQALSNSSAPLTEVAFVAMGNDAFVIFSVIALFSTANTVLLMMIGGSRVLYGMAESGSLPEAFATVHAKKRTPWVAITFFAGLSILFVFIDNVVTVANISNFTIFIIFFMVNVSLIRLRYTEPHLKRPFKSPINIGRFPVLSGVGALVTVFLFSHLSTEAMIYGFIILLGGGLVVCVR
ncbi:MAG: amino acid permease [Methanosarcinaceae archaeon]|nr:amino acid permease [Methanosarcinaceae archaeon]